MGNIKILVSREATCIPTHHWQCVTEPRFGSPLPQLTPLNLRVLLAFWVPTHMTIIIIVCVRKIVCFTHICNNEYKILEETKQIVPNDANLFSFLQSSYTTLTLSICLFTHSMRLGKLIHTNVILYMSYWRKLNKLSQMMPIYLVSFNPHVRP